MVCPICKQSSPNLIYHFHGPQDKPILLALQSEAADWKPDQGVCSRCVDQAQIDHWQESGASITSSDQAGAYWILPIPKRLTANPGYTGKGITICFIDSGFYPHPDLVSPVNRILKMVDIQNPEQDMKDKWNAPNPLHWHGTMTAVTGAGNGYLSDGIYRSLAPEAKVVLIKVMDNTGKITGDSITKALKWVENNHAEYGIRVINLSVTDDWATSYRESEIDLAIERLVNSGINVVAAAGNDSSSQLLAPANSPHAITVGGLDDANTLHPLTHSLYHSTYGQTIDQTYKPEIIAPAIWLPIPILPETNEHREATALFQIQRTQENYRKAVAANLWYQTSLPRHYLMADLKKIDQVVAERIEEAKYISADYQHGDGTSFAAPIVCSVIAQMLEANPSLSPTDVRDLLLRTARKLPDFAAERQGFGVIHPLSAVHHAERDHHPFPPHFSPVIDYKSETTTFHYHDDLANEVTVALSFYDWQEKQMTLTQSDHHLWENSTPHISPGKHAYKFRIDSSNWQTDTRNLFREPDGLGGFNSLIFIEQCKTE